MRTLRICLLTLATTCLTHGADIVWTNTSDGNWTTAGNWSPNVIPGSGDTAFITNNGTYTVTLSANATVAGIIVGGTSGTQTLEGSSRTLTVTSAGILNAHGVLSAVLGDPTLSLSSGRFTNSGTLNIGSGRALFVIQGVFTFDTGIISGPGTLDFAGTTINFTTDFANAAALLQFNANGFAGSCTVNGPGTITNLATLNLVGTAFNAPLVNQALLNGSSAAHINGLFQNQSGATLITSSQLFIDNGFSNAGAIIISNTSLLRVNTGTLMNAPGAQISAVTGGRATRRRIEQSGHANRRCAADIQSQLCPPSEQWFD